MSKQISSEIRAIQIRAIHRSGEKFVSLNDLLAVFREKRVLLLKATAQICNSRERRYSPEVCNIAEAELRRDKVAIDFLQRLLTGQTPTKRIST